MAEDILANCVRMKTNYSNIEITEIPNELRDITGRPIRTNVSNEDRNPQDPSTWGKVARNEDCPCGSGKKYKHCHGAI